MAQERKRKIRLFVSFGFAVVLAAALVYVSFTASSQAKSPSEVLAATEPGVFEVYGVVVDGSISRDGDELVFAMADRDNPGHSIEVEYNGAIPDPFREGREVIVTGELEGDTLVARRDSLITKCPSKFEEEDEGGSAT